MRTAIAAIMLAALSAPALAENLFIGDTKLACEAKLCLSANFQRPHECEKPVRRYCEQNARKPHERARMRDAFLRKCPDGGQNVKIFPPC